MGVERGTEMEESNYLRCMTRTTLLPRSLAGLCNGVFRAKRANVPLPVRGDQGPFGDAR